MKGAENVRDSNNNAILCLLCYCHGMQICMHDRLHSISHKTQIPHKLSMNGQVKFIKAASLQNIQFHNCNLTQHTHTNDCMADVGPSRQKSKGLRTSETQTTMPFCVCSAIVMACRYACMTDCTASHTKHKSHIS